MIKFFRKRRYDLMAKNKIGKYLKYAIGEIVLVVIGILIALSINTWNESRKIKEQEKELLTTILENIKLDSTVVSSVTERKNIIIDVHKNLVRFVNGEINNEKIKNIDIIRSAIPNAIITKKNNPELSNKVFSNSVKSAIFKYYQDIELFEFGVENFNDIIEKELRPFLAKKQLLNYGSQFRNIAENTLLLIDVRKFLKEIEKPELQQVLFEAGIKFSFIDYSMNNLRNSNERLRVAITAYLSK
jgi:hypothetical protein